MWKAIRPYRSVYPGLGVLLVLLVTLLAIAIRAIGPLHFLGAFAFGALPAWALRRLRKRSEPSSQPDFAAWATASAMTYGLSGSPTYRRLSDHQRAVRQVFLLRDLGAETIARKTRLPYTFVASVLRHLDEDGEGGAGVGARLSPDRPRPLSGAE